MSAIFGIFYTEEKITPLEDLKLMNAALASFGPDNNNLWHSAYVGMGQREINITPEDHFNRAPLITSDKHLVMVCDSRVDNRSELINYFDICYPDSKEMTDSEFIILAYEKWGVDCVYHLIGDIAFALWDQPRQQLLLARSPVGNRPLFYHSSTHQFSFASMPQGILALPKIPRELDLEFLADYLLQTGNTYTKSFFKDIYSLPPGHIAIVNRNGHKIHNFWQPDVSREIRFQHDDDYLEAFNELFERSVSDRLRSKSPVGVMMSGGLDSTSVAAVAASQLQKKGLKLATFTEVPRDGFADEMVTARYADETPYVEAMARRYSNIDLNLVRTDGGMYLDNLDTFFDFSFVPFRNASNRVWYEAILREAADQGVRVLLTGAQGNLTISRTGNELIPRLIQKGKWGKAFLEARHFSQNNLASSTLRALVGQGVMPLLPPNIWLAIQKMRGKIIHHVNTPPWHGLSLINQDFIHSLNIDERIQNTFNPLQSRPKLGINKQLYALIPRLIAGGSHIDHAYRAMFGVEMRDPTADQRIVEFCLALPEDQYQKDGIKRRLIRRTMKDRLPDEILENQLRGLQSADWFERLINARERILQVTEEWNDSSLLPSILDLDRLRHMVRDMPYTTADTAQLHKDYRFVLEFGLMTGSFVRWFEKSGDSYG